MSANLSFWVTVEMPQGGTVTVYGKPETWPEWIWKLVALTSDQTVCTGPWRV